MNIDRPLVAVLLLMTVVIACAGPSLSLSPETTNQGSDGGGVRTYVKESVQFRYQLQYPLTWVFQETGNTTRFAPGDVRGADEGIFLVTINYKATPPPPVFFTYTTLRTVRIEGEEVQVRKREPGPVSEWYLAELKRDDYVFEFRFSLERKYDDVFDNVLSTFKFTRR